MKSDGKYYPDTTLLTTFIRDNYGNDWERWPDVLLYASWTSSWKNEKELIHSLSPSDTVSIFIFHTDTLMAYPWETIRDEYKILVRYDLNWEDIRNVNYHILYPPTYEMERMHMWPPFKDVIARYQQ